MSLGNRVTWIDFAKAIGIIAIVYGHTIQSGITNTYVYSFHVPLFFFLQGVVFSVSKSEQRPFKEFVKKKAYSLLLPYYIFAVISTVVMFFVACFIKNPELDFIRKGPELIKNIIIGDCEANRPLWFLPCTFVLSLISYSIIKLSNRSKDHRFKYTILIVTAILSCVLLWITEEYTDIRFLPWKIDGAIHMVSFFLFGYMLNELGIFFKILKMPMALKVIIIIVFLTIGAVCGVWNEVAVYRSNYYGNIGLFLVSAAFTIMGICVLSIVLPNAKIIISVGKSTLCILLMHKFPVLLFQKVIPFTGVLLKSQLVFVGIVISVFSIIVCYIAEIIIEKVCPFIIGRYKKV